MLLPRLFDEFESYMLTERGASDNTITAYRSTLRRLTEFIADNDNGTDFEDVSTADLRRFIADIKQTGVTNATIARHVHALRSFWRFVVETYDLGKNSALPLRAPSPDHHVPDVLSVEECQQLLAAADENYYCLYRIRDRVLLKLLMVVGLRRGELLDLRLSDYDPDRQKLTVDMSKGRKSRVVPLPADLCDDLDQWLEVRPVGDNDHLLTTRTGNHISPTCLYRSFSKLVEHAGLDDRGITPHVLRHTAATQILKNSSDLVATSQLLGHSSVAVTGDTYCHLTGQDVREAVSHHPLALSATESDAVTRRNRAAAHPSAVVLKAEQLVDERLEQYRRAIEQDNLDERILRKDQIIETIRHYVRPEVAIASEVVRRVAFEDEVVRGFTLAEHQRITALRDVLLEISGTRTREEPWSKLLASIAEKIALGDLQAPSVQQAAHLDRFQEAVLAPEFDQAPFLRLFTRVFLGVAKVGAFPQDNLLVSQIAANILSASPKRPLIFVSAWPMPLYRSILSMPETPQKSEAICLLLCQEILDCIPESLRASTSSR